MMEWIKVTTHLAPMLIQAGLLNLVWTHPDQLQKPMIRWTRLSLLPISLSFLLSDLWNLKYNSQLSIFIKTNLGCTFGGHAFRLALLALQQPEPQKQAKGPSSDEKSTPKASVEREQSALQNLASIFMLALAGSTNPSKKAKISSGVNQGIRDDMIFLMTTLRRLIFLHFSSVIALIFWKITSDESLTIDQPILKLLGNYKSEIRAFSWGMFVWIGIDLQGCLPRISMFALKILSRLLSNFVALPTMISKQLEKFKQIDLSQACPFYYKNLPLGASSLTDFWSRHWHEILKDLFIEAGVAPVTYVLVSFLGLQAKSTFVRISGIMGAFTISAVLHEVGIWSAGPLDPTFKTSIFFLSQGVGVCLENGFKKISGRKVNGFLGRIWLLTWLVYFGQPMVSIWLENLGFNQNNVFRKVDDIGLFRLMYTPFIVPKLLMF
ncbi:hypothetical protein PGT21_017147 [Puccinia graminis f. sp. tritici]|uniref:Wax synthase domain-containing protein n=2 Tax=Puccinia graminis f. sp. tritici TaxID=56615 RepID=A0A5B0NP65_PUCGR|nr:hypothetical protein PGTUg99_008473 [Puccinia graminis f. sp. tritici]KAA1105732.1 hypothetical protein PGT21_017147 [Puccinia graminis f. sp. tritici]